MSIGNSVDSSFEILTLEKWCGENFAADNRTDSAQVSTSGNPNLTNSQLDGEVATTDGARAIGKIGENQLHLKSKRVLDFLRTHRHYLVDCEQFVGALLPLSPQLVSIALCGEDIVG